MTNDKPAEHYLCDAELRSMIIIANRRLDEINDLNQQHDALMAELIAALEALSFYADRDSWKYWDYHSECKDTITVSDLGCKSMNEDKDFAIPSGGRRARQALSRLDKFLNKGEGK